MRPKIRRRMNTPVAICTWVLLALALLSVAIQVSFSRPGPPGHPGPQWRVWVDNGALRLRVGSPFPGWHFPAEPEGLTVRWADGAEWWVQWLLPYRDSWGPFEDYSVPICLPVLLTGLGIGVTRIRIVLKRQRIRSGRCGSCGYNRTGLAPAAACPECGALV